MTLPTVLKYFAAVETIITVLSRAVVVWDKVAKLAAEHKGENRPLKGLCMAIKFLDFIISIPRNRDPSITTLLARLKEVGRENGLALEKVTREKEALKSELEESTACSWVQLILRLHNNQLELAKARA